MCRVSATCVGSGPRHCLAASVPPGPRTRDHDGRPNMRMVRLGKVLMTNRWKSGRGNRQRATSQAAAAPGRPGVVKRSILLRKERNSAVRTIKGILQRRHVRPRKGSKREPSVSFVAKATEEAKILDGQPRRTLRRTGSGIRREPSGQQGRSHGVAGPHPAEGVA